MNLMQKLSRMLGITSAAHQPARVISDVIYIVITVLAVVLPAAYWYFTAPPPGYCVEQGRVLSDKEVIELAGVYGGKQYGQKMVDGKASPPLLCCYLKRREGGFWSKMFRIDEGVDIGWFYERSQEAMQIFNIKDKYNQADRTFDSCVIRDLHVFDTTVNSIPKNKQPNTK